MKRRLFLLATTVLLSASLCLASESPRDVVEQFCELDFNGHRLSSAKYPPIKALTMYPGEPGWDIALGVRSYEIGNETIEDDLGTVEVRYVIDRAWPQAISDQSKYQVETFHLQRHEGGWKLTRFIMYPRVSSELLCRKYKFCESEL